MDSLLILPSCQNFQWYIAGVLDRYVKILEEKFKNKLLQTVYAGVNGKAVDDPDMQAFFKFKCWT